MKIFFSYGHDANAEFVELIREELKKRHPDYDIWFDKSHIRAGDNWRRSIYDGISSSDAVVACLSKHSVDESGVCRDELRIAAGEPSCVIASILLESPEDVQLPLAIAHIQYLDLSNWRAIKQDGEETFNAWLHTQLDEIEAILEKDKNFSGEIEELKQYLLPGNAYASYISFVRGLLKYEFVGRDWVFEKIEKWLANDSGRKIFCITGEPGFGKSALIAQFLVQNRILAGGVHFCRAKSYLDTPRNIILSLAFQMGTRLPAYRKYLLKNRMDLDRLSDDDLFVNLIAEASTYGIDGGRLPCLLIIDGLDEASGELAEFIANHVNELPHWLYIVVTSRPNEKHVRPRLASMNPLYLSVMDENNREDARIFVNNWLANEGFPEYKREPLIQSILDKSKYNFRYLSMLRDMNSQGVIKLEKIADDPSLLPSGLSSLYQSYMDRVFADPQDFEKTGRSLLGILAICGSCPMDKRALHEILKKNGVSESQLKTALNDLGSLIRVEKGKDDKSARVSLYHKTVADWLLSDENSSYCLDSDESRISLIQYLWKTLVRSMGNEKKRLEFLEKYGILLARLIQEHVLDGDDFDPSLINDIDLDRMEDLAITSEDMEATEPFLRYMLSTEAECWNRDLHKAWIFSVWILKRFFYGAGSLNEYGAILFLTELYPPVDNPQLFEEMMNMFQHLTGCGDEYKKFYALVAFKSIDPLNFSVEQQKTIMQLEINNIEFIEKYTSDLLNLSHYYYWLIHLIEGLDLYQEIDNDLTNIFYGLLTKFNKLINEVHLKRFNTFINDLPDSLRKRAYDALEDEDLEKSFTMDDDAMEEIRDLLYKFNFELMGMMASNYLEQFHFYKENGDKNKLVEMLKKASDYSCFSPIAIRINYAISLSHYYFYIEDYDNAARINRFVRALKADVLGEDYSRDYSLIQFYAECCKKVFDVTGNDEVLKHAYAELINVYNYFFSHEMFDYTIEDSSYDLIELAILLKKREDVSTIIESMRCLCSMDPAIPTSNISKLWLRMASCISEAQKRGMYADFDYYEELRKFLNNETEFWSPDWESLYDIWHYAIKGQSIVSGMEHDSPEGPESFISICPSDLLAQYIEIEARAEGRSPDEK